MSEKQEVSADVSVEELVETYPEAIGFLAERGVICIRCGEPYWGTLRDLMETKGMSTQVERLVAELNRRLLQ